MFTVYIKNNKTSETRQYINKDEDWFDLQGAFHYMWTDGNYGCDCNRALYFCRAVNEDETEARDQECGDCVAYSVPFVILGNGTKILIDGADL